VLYGAGATGTPPASLPTSPMAGVPPRSSSFTHAASTSATTVGSSSTSNLGANGGPASSSNSNSSSSVTGLPVVELAHWRALQSVCGLCCALGAGHGAAPDMAQVLHDVLLWLSGDVAAAPPTSQQQPAAGQAAAGAGVPGSPSAAAGCSNSPGGAASGASMAPPGPAAAAAAVGQPDDFSSRSTPLGIVTGLLPTYEVQHVERQLSHHLAGPSGVVGLPGALLRSPALTTWGQLISDPYLLLLELFAVGLSAFGPLSSATAAAAAAPPGGEDHLPASACDLLMQLLRAVYPLGAVQAAAWAMSSGALPQEIHDRLTALATAAGQAPAGSTGGTDALTRLSALVVAAESLVSGSAWPGSRSAHDAADMAVLASLREAVAYQVLPLLVRAYALQCLVKRETPSTELLRTYNSLLMQQQQQQAELLTQQQVAAQQVQHSPGVSLGMGLLHIGREGSTPTSDFTSLPPLRIPQPSDMDVDTDGPATPHAAREAAAMPTTPGAGVLRGGAVDLAAQLAGLLGLPTDVLAPLADVTSHPAPSLLLARWCPHLLWSLQERQAASSQGQAALQLHSSAGQRTSPGTSSGDGAAAASSNQTGTAGSLACRSPAPAPLSLICLPDLFQDLYLHYADKVCRECGKKPEHPGLCLVTGRLLCTWWRGCVDNRGGGLLHAVECCAATSLFLSLKSTKVVAIRNSRLAICQSPYLDAHGEEDPELRRGRPLYLDRDCYEQLGRLWAANALEFDSHMLHSSRVDLAFL